MTFYTLWVIRGLRGPGADAAARRLWEGSEDEQEGDPRPLDVGEVRGAAEALRAAHPELVVDPSELDPENPTITLEWSSDDSSLDVQVDGSGVLAKHLGHGTPAENEADLTRALAVVRSAAARLEGSIFDPQLGRIVDPGADAAAILAAARETWARPSASGSPAAGRMLLWLPLAGFLVAAIGIRVVGPIAFLAIPVSFFIVAAVRKRSSRPAAAPAPPVDNRPINP